MRVKEFIENAKDVIETYKVKSLGEFEYAFSEKYPDEKEVECVSYAQSISNHRWYNTAVNVYMLEDGFVGIRAGYQLFSEELSWDDVTTREPTVSIYEAYQTIAYMPKILN